MLGPLPSVFLARQSGNNSQQTRERRSLHFFLFFFLSAAPFTVRVKVSAAYRSKQSKQSETCHYSYATQDII